MGALKAIPRALLRRIFADRSAAVDPALQVSLGWLTFPNPVGLAAGFDKNAEALECLEILGFGFLEAGTLTPRPQSGNPAPRLFRFPRQQALVNRLGFNNVGVEAVSQRFSRGVDLNVPLGFNIGKFKDTPLDQAAGDYIACLEKLFAWAEFFVVNVSSPNTPGLRDLQAPADLEPLLTAIKEKNDALALQADQVRQPLLFVKLSPDEESYEEMVEVAVRAGFNGIVATNTTRGREGLPAGAPKEGGMSGRPLRDKSTEVIRRVYKAAQGRLHVIGVGGVFTAEDAYEKILAGASLVEVYTGFVYGGMSVPHDINQGLLALLKRDGLSNIQQAVGQKA